MALASAEGGCLCRIMRFSPGLDDCLAIRRALVAIETLQRLNGASGVIGIASRMRARTATSAANQIAPR